MRDVRRRAVVIGDGQMAAQCAKLILAHQHFEIPVLIHHESGHQWGSAVPKLAKSSGISCLPASNVNDHAVVSALRQVAPDVVFSVNNWDIIRSELLEIPADGVINFHNGPLPSYRGVNVPSWAIINGETQHGVTWHFVTKKIDGGDIVASETFEIGESETAISLTLRCIATGVKLFGGLLDRYAAGDLVALPQRGEGRYFSARDLPPNRGYLDLRMGFDHLSALVRGLTFRPFDNLFTYPRLRTAGETLLVSDIAFREGRLPGKPWTCGRIQDIGDREVTICAGDAVVALSGLMLEDLSEPAISEIAHRCRLAAGECLPLQDH